MVIAQGCVTCPPFPPSPQDKFLAKGLGLLCLAWTSCDSSPQMEHISLCTVSVAEAGITAERGPDARHEGDTRFTSHRQTAVQTTNGSVLLGGCLQKWPPSSAIPSVGLAP